MLAKVKNTIEKYQLLSKGDRVIVGFSAGIDSLSLLHLLHSLTEYQLDIWAVYINHSLRPLENLNEERLLEELGRDWGIKTQKFTVDIPSRLKEKPDSLQLLARKERYKIFNDFRNEIKADKVALAHQLDDQVETILYRIIRGTGLDGLAGIPVTRDGFFIRPLLEVTRKEIIEYATLHNLTWLEDSSNHKLIYQRNKIRLQLLPLLEEEYNPRVKDGLVRLAKLAREQRDFMGDLVAERLPELLVIEQDRTGLKLSGFLKQPPYLQYHILKYFLLKVKPDYHLETIALEKLLQKINQENYLFKAMHIYQQIIVYREGELLFFGAKRSRLEGGRETYDLTAPGENILTALNLKLVLQSVTPPTDWNGITDHEVYVEPAKISLPLKIRFWRPGDVFRPLGSPGIQKLHDFFINNKLPRAMRTEIPLLVTADDRIVWVIGYRLSDEFKIDHEAAAVWRITVTSAKED
jgi:tRNA(Ile)-lysidine synthase